MTLSVRPPLTEADCRSSRQRQRRT